jgi:hypothetical protein
MAFSFFKTGKEVSMAAIITREEKQKILDIVRALRREHGAGNVRRIRHVYLENGRPVVETVRLADSLVKWGDKKLFYWNDRMGSTHSVTL